MNTWKQLRNKSALVALLAVAPHFAIRAQSPAAGAPPPPYVTKLTPDMEWKITVTPVRQDIPANQRQLKEIRGSRSQETRREVLVWSDMETERWYTKSFLLESLPGRTDVLVSPFPKNPKLVETRLAALSELNWLSSSTYRGIVERNGMPTHHHELTQVIKPEIDGAFADEIKAGKASMPPDIVFHYQAWIDTQTGLPIAFESQDLRYEYAFSKTSKVSLTVPPRYLQAARQFDPAFQP